MKHLKIFLTVIFVCCAVNFADAQPPDSIFFGDDTVKITPANFLGGTQITFNAAGEGCTKVFDGTNWNVISNNGSSIT